MNTGSTVDDAISQLSDAMWKVNLDPAASIPSTFQTAEDDPVPTPFESIASAILDLIVNIGKLRESAYKHYEEAQTRHLTPDEPSVLSPCTTTVR